MNILKKILSKFRKIPKKFLIIGAILLVLFLVFSPKKKATAPQFAKAQIQDLKQEVSASGIINGKNSADLKFNSGGKLAYINVNPGDTVVEGQAIAGLDTTDLQAQLREAQSNFRDKQATVDKIHDDLKGVGASETFAQRQTRTTAEVAQDNAYDNLLMAKKALNDATIFSPISGTITSTSHVVGEQVSSSDTVAQVADFSQILFASDVDEADISKVKIGQKAEVNLNAYPDQIFKGEVSEIVPQTKTTASGATVVTVKVSLSDQTIQHISGLNGTVNIIQKEKDHVLSVPLDAIVNNNSVFVRTPNGIRRQRVTVGFKTDSDVEITTGLNDGEEVVENPTEVVPNAGNRNNPLLRIFGGLGGRRNGPR